MTRKANLISAGSRFYEFILENYETRKNLKWVHHPMCWTKNRPSKQGADSQESGIAFEGLSSFGRACSAASPPYGPRPVSPVPSRYRGAGEFPQ